MRVAAPCTFSLSVPLARNIAGRYETCPWPHSKDYERKRTRGRDAGALRPRPPPQGADLRRPASRREPAPLRLPARAGRRARELGGAEGRAARAGHAASRRSRRGSPAVVRDVRGRDPAGELRRRHGRDLGPAAPTSSSRRSRTAASPSTCTARGSNGLWTLVPAKLGGDPKNWLIVKKKEEDAAAASRKPRTYRPMLATLADAVPAGDEWLHEVKWDGYRAIATMRGGEVELRSRNDNQLNDRFPTVVRALEQALRTPDCVLDGEVVAVGEDGRATFSAMQQGKEGTTYIYVAFDVLEIDGEPLVDEPLVGPAPAARRARRLEATRRPALRGVRRRGRAVRGRAGSRSSKGVVSKRADSRYEPGRRSRNWLKVKTQGRQELVIVGYTKGQGRRSDGFGALVLGVNEGGRAALGRQRRHGLRRRGDQAPARQAEAAAARDLAVRRGAEDAARAEGRRRLGRAEAGRRGPLRRVDARRPAAGAGLSRVARGQGGGGRAPRAGGDRAGDPEGQAGPEALEPRQAVLAGRGDHQGRPARLLPGHRARARAPPARPARSR